MATRGKVEMPTDNESRKRRVRSPITVIALTVALGGLAPAGAHAGVIFESRDSEVHANSAVHNAGSGTSTGPREVESFDPGDFDESVESTASASGDDINGDPISASGRGEATQDSTVSAGPGGIVIDAGGSVDATAAASGVNALGGPSGHGLGLSDLFVTFEVEEGSTATYSLGGSHAFPTHGDSEIELDGPDGELFHVDSEAGPASGPVSQSGTLIDGRYTLKVSIEALAEVNNTTGGANEPTDNGSFNVGLTVTPQTPPGADTDGDGLRDSWEEDGVDVDGDGTPDLDLPSMGSDPDHKDVFVEVDHMAGHEIPNAQIARVVQAFADAPVANPDGQSGITLHVDNGAASVMDPGTGTTWGAISDQEEVPHQNVLGTEFGDDEYDWSQFESLRQTRFAAARRPVFHYAIAAHSGPDNDFSGIAQGIPSGDFLIMTHETCAPSQPLAVECTPDADAQAATFMHELGHTLGLRHGGTDGLNRKPNYLSVMNYNFGFGLRQFTGVGQQTEFALDYSRYELHLDERSLDEQHAFPISSGPATEYATAYRCPTTGAFRVIPVLDTPVDWTCNGQISTFLTTADITKDTERTDLPGAIDWTRLVFDGGAVGDLSEPPAPDTTPLDEPTPEEMIAAQEALAAGPVDDSGLPREPAPGSEPAPADPPPGEEPPANPPDEPRAQLTLELAKDTLRARAGRRLVLEYFVSLPSEVELEIRKRSKTLASISREVEDGSNRIAWNGKVGPKGKRRPAPPGTYTAALTAHARDGQRVFDEAKVKIKGR
jgi:hypothetical protein